MKSSRACRLVVFLSALLLSREAFPQTGIVAIGDSNTAGYGVARHQAFPARLEALLRSAGYDVQVWNAGVPGDTFGSISARLDRYVPDGIQIVIVQGGYNDVLRRTDANSIVAYLGSILSRLRARGIHVVLCGFFYPDWDAAGATLARNYGAVFVDGGSCYDNRYRGGDGLHMSAAGHQVVAARLLPLVESLLGPAPLAHPTRGTRAVGRASAPPSPAIQADRSSPEALQTGTTRPYRSRSLASPKP